MLLEEKLCIVRDKMFGITLKPHPHKTEAYLDRLKRKDHYKVLEQAAQSGVEALAKATPKKTGKTAASWTYEIVADGERISIYWKNDNVTKDGDPIAILLQYGHGTGTGGYVTGLDYINPAIRPVFDNIVDEVWKVMTAL